MLTTLNDPVLSCAPAVRLAFLETLSLLAHADGVIDDQEVIFLTRMAEELQLEVSAEALLQEARPMDDARAELLEPIAGYVVLQGALLVVADGHCHIAERELLEELASALDVAPDLVGEVLAWAELGTQWIAQGVGLMARLEGLEPG